MDISDSPCDQAAVMFLHSILHHHNYHHLSHILSRPNKLSFEKFNHFTCQLPCAGSCQRGLQIKLQKMRLTTNLIWVTLICATPV